MSADPQPSTVDPNRSHPNDPPPEPVDPSKGSSPRQAPRYPTLPTAYPATGGQPGELKPDFALPGYQVLGQLGKGGMGVVYKARQLKADRLVALKMILASKHASLEERIRF